MHKSKPALWATLLLAVIPLQAKYKDDKIAKDDIPRNEKKLWMRIDQMQADMESSLLSGDQRFLDQLDLARKKVADIMLTAETEKKAKKAVKELPRAWIFWKRVLAQVEIDDVNEYNLNAALGQRAPVAAAGAQEQAPGAEGERGLAYPTPAAPQPTSVVVNNYIGQSPPPQPQAQYAAAPEANYPPPQQQQYVGGYYPPPQPYYQSYGNNMPQQSNGYLVFGFTPPRPRDGYLRYEKATRKQPGYYYRGNSRRGGGGRR